MMMSQTEHMSPAVDEEADVVTPDANDGTHALDRFLASTDDMTKIPTTDVLKRFGRTRRGAVVNDSIGRWFREQNLEMFPDIADADYYGEVTVRRAAREAHVPSLEAVSSNPATPPAHLPGVNSWVLSSLKDDAEALDVLEYGESVETAVDRMKERNRTKLPLFFSSHDRSTLIGTVTLAELTFENTEEHSKLIERATTQVPVVSTNEKLFDWIPAILSYGFIYGKNQEDEIVQIYTTHDVATHLNGIAAMFLRANEIEELVREALAGVDDSDLQNARGNRGDLTSIDLDGNGKHFQRSDISPSGATDTDQRVVDKLTFGEYMKCIGDPHIWSEHFSRPDIAMMDKERCLRSLNDARLARNAVMHFNRSSSMGNHIPTFEALAVWLRRIVSARQTHSS
jgi:hypothetical protein